MKNHENLSTLPFGDAGIKASHRKNALWEHPVVVPVRRVNTHGERLIFPLRRHQGEHKRVILHQNTWATSSQKFPQVILSVFGDLLWKRLGFSPADQCTLHAVRGLRGHTLHQLNIPAILHPHNIMVIS
ncbi:exo-alpha-sialidase [Trypanosoma cruzi]|nr:exo-alpha-sialidase [Trypanosoma cruzi]